MIRPAINVTPLIDVLLVLLIIFMIITPIRPSSFEAMIPSEQKLQSPDEPDLRTLVVTVDDNLSLRLNHNTPGASVNDPNALVAHLQEIFRLRAQNLENERAVFIKAPRKIGYGSVAKVVDAVKLAGADPISLQIDVLE